MRITSEACVGSKPLVNNWLYALLGISNLPLIVLITLSLYLFLNEMGRLRTKVAQFRAIPRNPAQSCAIL